MATAFVGLMIDVAEVAPADLMRFAGESWGSVVAAAGDGVEMKRHSYGHLGAQQERGNKNWKPFNDKNGNPVEWLPVDRAWLREVDGRAFLYLQN